MWLLLALCVSPGIHEPCKAALWVGVGDPGLESCCTSSARPTADQSLHLEICKMRWSPWPPLLLWVNLP